MRFIITLIFFLILFSCQKEEPTTREISAKYCHDNMEFTCDDSPDDEIFFKGKINGEEFCVSVPHRRFQALNGVAVTSTTSTDTPILTNDAPIIGSFYSLGIYPPIFDNFNGIVRDFQPFIILETPKIADTTVYTAQTYIEDYLKKGVLPLRTNDGDKATTFDFRIAWSCAYRPGYYYYVNKYPGRVPVIGMGVSPSYGSSPNAQLELIEFIKKETHESIKYFLTFEIECDLYQGNKYYKGDYFGKLEDGVFKTIIEILK